MLLSSWLPWILLAPTGVEAAAIKTQGKTTSAKAVGKTTTAVKKPVPTTTAKVVANTSTAAKKVPTTTAKAVAKTSTVAKKPITTSSKAFEVNKPSTTIVAPQETSTGAAITNITLIPIEKSVLGFAVIAGTDSCTLAGSKGLAGCADCSSSGVVPKTNITLHYGLDGNSLVEIDLSMLHSTVVLEDVPSIESVDCDATSVYVTFNDTGDFTIVTSFWAELVDSFVLITNHMGDCDREFERGFFLADVDTMSITAANMSVRVFAEKTDAQSTGKEMSLRFSDMPALAARHNLRNTDLKPRGINVDKNGLSISTDVNLNPGITLNGNDESSHFTVTVDHAQINSSVTYSGALKFDFHDMRLKDFWFDVKKNIYHNLALTFEFRNPYVYNLEYEIPVVSYYAVDIPGIINLGPELTLGIGIEFDVQAAVTVKTNFSSRIVDGQAHVDFLDGNKTSVTNWKPSHSATADISESGSVTITPMVEATVQLACALFNEVLDLSTGVTAMAGFPFVISATTTQAGIGSGNVTLPEGEDCPNGFGYHVDFAVIITAFATSWLKRDFEVYTKPLGSWCLPWIFL